MPVPNLPFVPVPNLPVPNLPNVSLTAHASKLGIPLLILVSILHEVVDIWRKVLTFRIEAHGTMFSSGPLCKYHSQHNT